MKKIVILSNRLEQLAESLKASIFDKTERPFTTRKIVTPSHAVKAYLMQRYAEDPELQVAAGMEFLTLSEIFCTPTALELSLLLEQHIPCLQEPLAYYRDLPPALQKKRIGQLAQQLSGLFLRYLVYGERHLEGWQRELWEKITQKQQARTGSYHLFGFSYLPPSYFKFFVEQKSCFYLLSPCQFFWTDLCTGKEKSYLQKRARSMGVKETSCETLASYLEEHNPLLSNLGKLGRRLMTLVEELITEEKYVEEEGTLLQSVQNDLLNLRISGGEEDSSIQIHSASSKLSEIEVLWELLHQFLNEGIPPKEVLILAPDINAYFPYISMVFGRKENKIEYSIADLEVGKQSRFLQEFAQLLSLPLERFERRSLLKLLTYSTRFTKEELLLIETWIEKTKVLWGMDAEQKALFLGCAQDDQGTWERGIDRLLSALTRIEEENVFSIDFTQAELLGKFATWVYSLNKDLSPLLQEREELCVYWIDLLKSLATKYCTLSDEDNDFFRQLDQLACLDAKVSFESIQRILKALFARDSAKRVAPHLQAVHFGSLKSGCAVPHQVIYLIGMQEESFPRSQMIPSFCLLRGKPEEPPSKAEEDRYLFLELLLSARAYFVMSYVNRDARDGKLQGPSVVVEELLSYTQKKVIEHSQHAKPYFGEQKPFLPKFRMSTSQEQEVLIDVKHLSALARHPIQFYFNRVLQIYLQRDENEKRDEFVLSLFGKAALRKASLKKDPAQVLRQAEERGFLPQGVFKDVAQKKILEEVEALRAQLEKLGVNSAELLSMKLTPLRIPLGENRYAMLTGKIENLSPQGLVVHGTDRLQDLVRHWPLFLVYLNLPLEGPPCLLCSKNGKMREFSGSAQEALARYIEYYLLCLGNRPLSKLALVGEIDDFYAGSSSNFETMCEHMAEKFGNEDAKKSDLNDQMEFRKRSNVSPLMPEWSEALLRGESKDLKKAIGASERFSVFPDPYLEWLFARERLDADVLFSEWSSYLRGVYENI